MQADERLASPAVHTRARTHTQGQPPRSHPRRRPCHTQLRKTVRKRAAGNSDRKSDGWDEWGQWVGNYDAEAAAPVFYVQQEEKEDSAPGERKKVRGSTLLLLKFEPRVI